MTADGLLAAVLLAIMRALPSANSSNVMKDVFAADEEHWGQVSDVTGEYVIGVSSITTDGCLRFRSTTTLFVAFPSAAAGEPTLAPLAADTSVMDSNGVG